MVVLVVLVEIHVAVTSTLRKYNYLYGYNENMVHVLNRSSKSELINTEKWLLSWNNNRGCIKLKNPNFAQCFFLFFFCYQDVYFTSEIKKKISPINLFIIIWKKNISILLDIKKNSAAFSKPQNGDSKCPWETRTEYCFRMC